MSAAERMAATCARCESSDATLDLAIARDCLATIRRLAQETEARRAKLLAETEATYGAVDNGMMYAAQAGGLGQMLESLIGTIGIYTEDVADHRKVGDPDPAPVADTLPAPAEAPAASAEAAQ